MLQSLVMPHPPAILLRFLAGAFLVSTLASCGLSADARDRADKARKLPPGTLVSSGDLSARTFRGSLIQETGKHGYLVLREPYLAPEFAAVFAAGLGSESDVRATWSEDQKKAYFTDRKTVRVHGKPVVFYHAKHKTFGGGGKQVFYAWLSVDGRGCKVELTEWMPNHLLEDLRKERVDGSREELVEFAESIRVKGA